MAASPWLRAARAEEPKESVELSWVRAEGAESCPDAASLRAGVSRRLGRDPFGAQPSLAIEAMATRDANAWNARIYARRDNAALGTRTLDSAAPSCDSLADAVALAIALLIDPEAVARQARATTVTLPTPPVPAPPSNPSASAPLSAALKPPAPSAAQPNTAKAPEHMRHVLAEAGAIASFGLLPGTAWGAGLAARVPLAAWLAAAVGFEFFPEREVTAAGGRFGFGLTAGSLGLCVEPLAPASFGLELCGQAELGAVHAVVYRLEPTVPGDRLFGAAGLSARIFVRPQRNLRISLGLGGCSPFAAYRFSVRGQSGTVFAQSQLAGGALMSVGVEL